MVLYCIGSRTERLFVITYTKTVKERNIQTVYKPYKQSLKKFLPFLLYQDNIIYTGSNFGGVNMELFCFYLHAFAYIKLFKSFLFRNVFFVHSTSIVVLFMVVEDFYIYFHIFLCDIFVPNYG